MEPTVTRPIQDPLAVLLLDNQLSMVLWVLIIRSSSFDLPLSVTLPPAFELDRESFPQFFIYFLEVVSIDLFCPHFCSFLYNEHTFQLSADDVIVSEKGSNGE